VYGETSVLGDYNFGHFPLPWVSSNWFFFHHIFRCIVTFDPHSSIHSFIFAFIHSVVCLTRGPQPLPMQVPHTVLSSASYFSFQYPLFSLRSSCSCSLFLTRLSVTSISLCSSPSVACFRGQFLLKI